MPAQVLDVRGRNEAAWIVLLCSLTQVVVGSFILGLKTAGHDESTLFWTMLLIMSIASIIKAPVSFFSDRYAVVVVLNGMTALLGILYFGLSMSHLFPAAC